MMVLISCRSVPLARVRVAAAICEYGMFPSGLDVFGTHATGILALGAVFVSAKAQCMVARKERVVASKPY